jgi:hypothetical protein
MWNYKENVRYNVYLFPRFSTLRFSCVLQLKRDVTIIANGEQAGLKTVQARHSSWETRWTMEMWDTKPALGFKPVIFRIRISSLGINVLIIWFFKDVVLFIDVRKSNNLEDENYCLGDVMPYTSILDQPVNTLHRTLKPVERKPQASYTKDLMFSQRCYE